MADTLTLQKNDALFCTQVPELYLFVCTGNTCRSPMAAALFNAFWNKRAVASSAGLAASGEPISDNAYRALTSRGIASVPTNNFAGHISLQVSEAMLRAASRVYGISQRHQMALISAFPEFAEKIFALPKDIPDPYGGDIQTYRHCLSMIEEALTEEFGAPADAGDSSAGESGTTSDTTPGPNTHTGPDAPTGEDK